MLKIELWIGKFLFSPFSSNTVSPVKTYIRELFFFFLRFYIASFFDKICNVFLIRAVYFFISYNKGLRLKLLSTVLSVHRLLLTITKVFPLPFIFSRSRTVVFHSFFARSPRPGTCSLASTCFLHSPFPTIVGSLSLTVPASRLIPTLLPNSHV